MMRFFHRIILNINPYVLISGLILFACETDDLSFTTTLQAPTFQLNAPSGWKLSQRQGYDTYVGTIAGPQGTISYDAGFSAFPGIDKVSRNAQTIYFEKTLINGVPAIIQKQKTPKPYYTNIREVLSVYIDAGNGVRNRLYVLNPGDQNEDLLIEIMKTHRFR